MKLGFGAPIRTGGRTRALSIDCPKLQNYKNRNIVWKQTTQHREKVGIPQSHVLKPNSNRTKCQGRANSMLARNTPQERGEREALMRALASRLEFSVENAGGRFTLLRTADVLPPVCEECLTLNQAEQLLQTWKLRGHG
jgi:hypothetical protein